MISLTCLSHGNQELRYYCASCDIKVCSDCVVSLHCNHEKCKVLTFAQLKSEVLNLHETVTTSIQNAKKCGISVKVMLDDIGEVISRSKENVTTKIGLFSSELLENIRKSEEDSLKYLDDKANAITEDLLREKNDVELYKSELKGLSKVNEFSSSTALDEIKLLGKK